jgi:spore coat polysaccharide biosynthesis protein SpsF (cytidylyltransferase family)
MKIVAIIQARMGSTRLPGKVMKGISSKPMLWHVLNRLSAAKSVDEIVIATTSNEQDKTLVEFAEEYGFKYFVGSENDVLDRYYQASKEYEADVIVRVTGDCPLVDPFIVDKVVQYYAEGSFDYVSNNNPPTYPHGLDIEVFSFKALEEAWRKSQADYQREHVTYYITEHPEIFKIGNVKNQADLSHLRLTVDEEADFILVSEVFSELFEGNNIFLMEDILGLLEKKPHLIEINKDVGTTDPHSPYGRELEHNG